MAVRDNVKPILNRLNIACWISFERSIKMLIKHVLNVYNMFRRIIFDNVRVK